MVFWHFLELAPNQGEGKRVSRIKPSENQLFLGGLSKQKCECFISKQLTKLTHPGIVETKVKGAFEEHTGSKSQATM